MKEPTNRSHDSKMAGSVALESPTFHQKVECTFLTLVLMSTSVAILAQPFPGCEGFGCETAGGQGGQNIIVTSLADAGPGTLREALNTPGPRVITFSVSGNIHLKSPLILSGESSSFVTIDAATAPGSGAQIVGWELRLEQDVHDVVLRNLRFGKPVRNWVSRTGAPPPCSTCPSGTGDCIDLRGARRVVIDQCSFRWASDENVSAERFVNTDVTIQRCIIALPLWNGTHEDGEHSRNMNLSRGADRWSIHRNLFAMANWRNPQISGCSGRTDCDPTWADNPVFDFRYNIVFGLGEQGMQIDGGAQVNIVGNLFLRGPESSQIPPLLHEDRNEVGTRFYLEGNSDSAGPADRTLVRTRIGNVFSTAPFSAPAITEPSNPLETEMKSWGALPHDSIDRRVLDSVAARTGSVGDQLLRDSLSCTDCSGTLSVPVPDGLLRSPVTGLLLTLQGEHTKLQWISQPGQFFQAEHRVSLKESDRWLPLFVHWPAQQGTMTTFVHSNALMMQSGFYQVWQEPP
ncbi:MAG: hypothetical protein AB1813_09880 [Verrucomicrobiota bacterium]